MGKAKIDIVQETEFGIYVWQLPNGQVVGDEEGHWMCIAAKEGDLRKIQALQEAARTYGVEEGRALFLPGRRKVTDEEHSRQKARLELGLIPDDYDAPAWIEEMKKSND